MLLPAHPEPTSRVQIVGSQWGKAFRIFFARFEVIGLLMNLVGSFPEELICASKMNGQCIGFDQFRS